jgi:hypothetical protein
LAGSIPSFVDKVINTSAGGAFTGAMTGAAMMGAATNLIQLGSMKSVSTGVQLAQKGLGGGVELGKKIAGGIQTGAELMDGSMNSILSQTTKKISQQVTDLNPLSQEKVESFGQKLGHQFASGLDQLTNKKQEKDGIDDYVNSRADHKKNSKEKSSKSTDIDDLN